MKRPHTSMPKAVFKHFIIRIGLGSAFLILFVVLLAVFRDFILSLPCIVLALFFLGSAALLWRAHRRGELLCVQGECVKVEKGIFRLRNKAVYLSTEHGTIKVIAFKAPRRIAAGEPLNLYLKKSARVYERKGEFTVSEYVALVRPSAE